MASILFSINAGCRFKSRDMCRVAAVMMFDYTYAAVASSMPQSVALCEKGAVK
jgi:hypothetical protein